MWGDDAGTVVVIDRDGHPKVRSENVWFSTSGLAWTPRGDEVWFAGETKGHARDVMSISLSGKERMVLPTQGRLILHDIAADGRALLAIENGRRESVLGHFADPQERNLSCFDWSRLSGLSHDGRFIAFEEQAAGVQGQSTVFVRSTDGAPAVRIGEGHARGNPISPDREWLAVAVGNPPQVQPLRSGRRSTRCPCTSRRTVKPTPMDTVVSSRISTSARDWCEQVIALRSRRGKLTGMKRDFIQGRF